MNVAQEKNGGWPGREFGERRGGSNASARRREHTRYLPYLNRRTKKIGRAEEKEEAIPHLTENTHLNMQRTITRPAKAAENVDLKYQTG